MAIATIPGTAGQPDSDPHPNASFQPAWWSFKPGTPISNTELTQSLEQFAANLDTVGSLMWGDRDISSEDANNFGRLMSDWSRELNGLVALLRRAPSEQ